MVVVVGVVRKRRRAREASWKEIEEEWKLLPFPPWHHSKKYENHEIRKPRMRRWPWKDPPQRLPILF